MRSECLLVFILTTSLCFFLFDATYSSQPGARRVKISSGGPAIKFLPPRSHLPSFHSVRFNFQFSFLRTSRRINSTAGHPSRPPRFSNICRERGEENCNIHWPTLCDSASDEKIIFAAEGDGDARWTGVAFVFGDVSIWKAGTGIIGTGWFGKFGQMLGNVHIWFPLCVDKQGFPLDVAIEYVDVRFEANSNLGI